MYILISVTERNIVTQQFGTYNEARKQMLEEVCQASHFKDFVELSEKYDLDIDYGVSTFDAWANFHDTDMDWKIVKIKEK